MTELAGLIIPRQGRPVAVPRFKVRLGGEGAVIGPPAVSLMAAMVAMVAMVVTVVTVAMIRPLAADADACRGDAQSSRA